MPFSFLATHAALIRSFPFSVLVLYINNTLPYSDYFKSVNLLIIILVAADLATAASY